MGALLFLGEVVVPVGVEVAVAADGAKFEDGLGSGQSPAGAGDVEAVLYQVPAGAFDDAGSDRPAAGQRGRVVQVGGLVGQVPGAGVGAGTPGGLQFGVGGLAAMAPATLGALPARIALALSWTHASTAGSPSA